MFCENCGKQIDDNSKFCEYCGAEVRKDVSNNQQSKSTSSKDKKKKIIIAISAIIGLFIIGIGVYFFCFNKTIDLNDYATIEVKGYDGYGNARLKFNYKKFNDDYGDVVEKIYKEKRTAEDVMDSLFGSKKISAEDYLEEIIGGKLSKSTGLSNGDVITYKWKINDKEAEELGLNFKYEDISKTVSGLKKASTFDPFENIQLDYEGFSPNATVSIREDYDDEYYSNLTYELDKTEGIKNGDEVTIKLSGDKNEIADECIEEFNKIPKYYSKKIKISGLDELLSDTDSCSDKIVDIITKDFKERFKTTQITDSEEKLKSIEYISNKIEYDSDLGENYVYFIFKVNMKVESKKIGFYAVAEVDNLCKSGNYSDITLRGDTIEFDGYIYDGFKKLKEAKDYID